MKLAITSRGPDLDAELDPRFGRARFFIVIDNGSSLCTAYDNRRNVDMVGRAGVSAARDMVRLGVDALITEKVGPRTFATLQTGGIEVYVGASGQVTDAVAQFQRGELERISEPTVEEHWSHILDL
jgi:predicted Fe-Mo cluster-binding NifX family protein